MQNRMRFGMGWVALGGLNAAIAVALGAWGAHGLESTIAEMPELAKRLANWDTAVRYHLIHAIALILGGLLLAVQGRSRGVTVALYLFCVGILLFSGCLYGWVLIDQKTLVFPVPLGGSALIVGWISLALSAWLGSGTSAAGE